MTDPPFPPAALARAATRQLGEPVRAFRTRIIRGLITRLCRRARPEAVYVFEHGFVQLPEAYRWDDLSSVTVDAVRHSADGRTRWRFTIKVEDGRTVRLDGDISEVDRLGEVIVAEVMRRVVPAYIAAVDNGGTVELGPFTVSGNGLEKDAELIPWPYVREVGMSNGVVYVARFDQVVTAAVTAARMPNAAAFLALCRHLGAQVG